jgi:manganese transport protein
VIIGAAFLMEMIFAKPAIGELVEGLIPGLPNNESLYIAIGIIGATVMPHNLYLHSSLVQSRLFEKTIPKIKEAIKYNFIDSAIALNLAFFVNAAILILAAATFYKSGMFEVSEIKDAHRFLQPLLGSVWAPMLFAIALIASGQSSTLTGTLAGQIIMEGYLNLRIKQWIRRIITRLLAIIPAVLTIVILGEGSVGRLLILSQVILSLQLGFAVIPLIHFVSDKTKMGEFAIGLTTRIFAWVIAGIIVLLNVKLVINQLSNWLIISHHKTLILLTIVPVAILLGILLLFITVRPAVRRFLFKAIRSPHKSIDLGDILSKTSYNRVAIAIDFSKVDTEVIRHAISLCQPKSKILIVHIVETAGAIIMGNEINDFETQQDQEILEKYKSYIDRQGFETEIRLGFGNPQKIIPEYVIEFKADILVMGAHGHKGLKDIIFGTTVDKVRHRVNIPVFIVKDKRVKT